VTPFPPPFQVAFDHARYPPAYLRLGLDEDQVQARVVARLRALGWFAHPVDAGAREVRGRVRGALGRCGITSAAVFAALANGGAAEDGFPDVVGVYRGTGRALFVEVKRPASMEPSPRTGRLIVKRPAGQPTPQQVAFLTEARRCGAAAGVVWSERDLDGILAVPRLVDEDAEELSTARVAVGKDLEKGPA
jgi:hypothetical protein